MTKKRLRAPGYSVSTKGHSVLRRGTYGMPSSRRAMLTVGEVYIPEYVPRTPTLAYDTRAEESALGYAVSRANYASCAALDDSYDTHAKSRGRDQRLLSDATQAIPPSTYKPLKASYSKTTAGIPRRRFLSRPRVTCSPPSQIFDDLDRSYKQTSSYTSTTNTKDFCLPTSSLVASPKPPPSLPLSLLKYTGGKPKGTTSSVVPRYSRGRSRLTGTISSCRRYGYRESVPQSYLDEQRPGKLIAGYVSPKFFTPYRSLSPAGGSPYASGRQSPTYKPFTTGGTTRLLGGYVSPRLASSYKAHAMSPYASLATSPYSSGLQTPVVSSYLAGLERTKLLGGYVSPRRVLHYRTPAFSPYASGRQSPIFPAHERPLMLQYSDPLSDSDTEYRSDTNYTRKRKIKVLGSKKRVGNYYERLLRRRAGKEGRSKYWPYYDVESIASSDLGGILSETESVPDYYTPEQSYDEEKPYDYDYEEEYVPFKPRKRLESPGLLELSPYSDSQPLPDLPHLSAAPYVPHSLNGSVTKSSVANDILFNSIVAASAARARNTFRKVDWNGYDNASLVLSVEGDVMSHDLGGKFGFKYYHPPVPLKGSGIEDRYLGLTPAPLSPTDSFFGNYLSKMRELRQDVRKHLDDKSVSLSTPTPTPSTYKQSVTYVPVKIEKHKNFSVPVTSFRKRLEGGLTHRLDVFPLPVSERVLPSSEPLSLPSSEPLSSHDKDSKDSPIRLTVLDKIRIKAAIVASKVETEPRRRRPRSKFAQDKLRAIQREARGEENVYTSSREPTGGLHASRPPMRYTTHAGYRLESRMDPTDIIYKPGSFVRMREQVRDAHDKLDRHRQLLDRYISDSRQTGGESVQGSVLRKMEELEKRDPVSGSSSAGAGSSSRGSRRRRN